MFVLIRCTHSEHGDVNFVNVAVSKSPASLIMLATGSVDGWYFRASDNSWSYESNDKDFYPQLIINPIEEII